MESLKSVPGYGFYMVDALYRRFQGETLEATAGQVLEAM